MRHINQPFAYFCKYYSYNHKRQFKKKLKSIVAKKVIAKKKTICNVADNHYESKVFSLNRRKKFTKKKMEHRKYSLSARPS